MIKNICLIVRSYIITTTLKTLEEVDKLLGKMRKGTPVMVQEVRDNVLITTEYQRII